MVARLSRLGVVIIAGLVTLCVSNLVFFGYTEKQAGFYLRAIHRYESVDLSAAAYRYDENARSRYSAYLALAKIAPGSTVIVAADHPGADLTVAQSLYSFGEAAIVVFDSRSSSQLLNGLDPAGFSIAAGPSGTHGPAWLIAVNDPPPVAGYNAQGFLDAAWRGEATPTSTARTFVLASWLPADSEADAKPQILLIDVALLARDVVVTTLP